MKKIEYKIGDDILKLINNVIYNLCKEKADTVDSKSCDITIHTGLAGLQQMDVAVKMKAAESGLVTVGELPGLANLDGFEYRYTLPFLGNVKIILTPEYDYNPISPNDTTDYINGWKKSSYTYSINQDNDAVSIELVVVENATSV